MNRFLFGRLRRLFLNRPSKVSKPAKCVRLVVESLEGRSVPAILHVGTGQAFTTLGAAAAVAQDGDTIQIDAGLYRADAAVATFTANNLTIEGVGGKAHVDASGFTIPNEKAIWVIQGNNTTVKNIEFSGASVPDHNGAGIRQEGTDLSLLDSYFHENEMGILTGADAASDILIQRCEFGPNGYEDSVNVGHNIYIGTVGSFTLRDSYSHNAMGGHLVKSRAEANYLLYNRLTDGPTADTSYEVDLPNGGESYLVGNVIEQGPSGSNKTIIEYGAEGTINAVQALYLVNNTLVNNSDAGTFVRVFGSPTETRLVNNIFAGPGTVLVGPGTLTSNLASNAPGFVNGASFDYHLAAGSAAINAGTAPGSVNGVDLTPAFQYQDSLGEEPRPLVGTLDIGAFEFAGGGPTSSPPTVAVPAAASPVTGSTTQLSVLGDDDGGEAGLTYTWSSNGPAAVNLSANSSNAAKNSTATFAHAGNYTFTVTIRDGAGLTTSSSATVTVNQTLTSLVVSPAATSVRPNGTQQFTAGGLDQFGNALEAQPTVAWAILSGEGSIDGSGLYTAPATSGTVTVQASRGAMVGTASLTISSSAPRVVRPASASTLVVRGKVVTLRVLGADNQGERRLTYTWSSSGPAAVTFSRNGSNAAKVVRAVFLRAGTYTFTVTAMDGDGLATTSSVAVAVAQRLTKIAVTPATATVTHLGTQQFTASAADQFGEPLTTQPAFRWQVLRARGQIDANGLYTAPARTGVAFVRVRSGWVSGLARIWVA